MEQNSIYIEAVVLNVNAVRCFMPAISKIVANGNALKQLLVPVVDSVSVSSNLKI